KITGGVTGKMAEDVAPQVASDSDECEARDPAGDPPKEVVSRDQRHEERECQPYGSSMGSPRRQSVDQVLHPVLRADRTSDRQNDRRQNGRMRYNALAHIAQ